MCVTIIFSELPELIVVFRKSKKYMENTTRHIYDHATAPRRQNGPLLYVQNPRRIAVVFSNGSGHIIAVPSPSAKKSKKQNLD
jgi:hypothetical protein